MYLAELTVYDRNAAATEVLRYSTGLGFVTGPAETPANTHYDPRILQPIDVSRHLFAPRRTMGRGVTIPGDLVLNNGDGELDEFLDLGIAGRQVVIRRTTVRRPAYPADFDTVLVGTMQLPEFEGDVVRIRLQDRRFDLEVPFQTTRYLGDGLATGLEGGSDVAGTLKPVCLGAPKRDVTPVCVNAQRLIYEHGADDASAVRVQGKPLTQGSDYASELELIGTAPSANQWRALPSSPYFRLGSSPAGRVTCDPVHGANAAARTCAQLFSVAAQRAPLVDSSDIEAADLTTLDGLDDSVLGFWTREDTTVAQVLDRIAATTHAAWWWDRMGSLRIRRFTYPRAADASLTLTEDDVVKGSLHRVATNDPGQGVPAYRQVVRWGRNYTPQTGDLDATLTDAERAELAREWLDAVSESEDVQTIHPLAGEMVRESLYTAQADAKAEADRRLDLYGPRRDMIEFTVEINDDTYGLDLFDTILFSHSDYGLETPSPWIVVGIEPNAALGLVTLIVWGGSTASATRITQDGDTRVTTDGDTRVTRAA